ncbi:amino acid adenylation domain-containing protein, partial [Cysteiniphilum sp. 5D8B4]|uniref:non-ribosomal peptide synthetase n=1 Tax=Cysteiniphilum sp. 5D8B4 TaxID=3453129 RepID=UPI003F83E5C9
MTQLKLTKQQDELWYAYKLNPNSDNYNIAVSYRVKGNLDKEKFKSIYITIGNHFEAFRTQFIENDGEAAQIIRDHFDGELIYQTLNDATEQKALDTIEALRAKPFNLEKDWLFRAILIKADDQTHYFQFVWHHIISDGLTTTIFSEAFEKLYNEGLKAIDQFKTYPLTDYLQYEASIIANKKNEIIDYWQNYLKGSQQNELAKYTHDDTGKINRKRLNIDSKVLNKLLKTHKTTPFLFFNALISTFIFRCFHLTDIVLSYPKNIRTNDFANIVGYFVSMFPMRVKVSADMTFAGLLYNIKQQYKEDRNHQEIAFEEIRKTLKFDVKPNISVMETLIISPKLMIKDSNCSEFRTYYTDSHTLFLAYGTTSDYFEVNYNQNHIPNKFIEYFENLINEVLTNTNKKLSDYEVMSIDQKKKLLYDWNKTDKPYPKNKTIHQLFEKQVDKHPNNIAVVFENKQLTYAQLNAKANQLARYLRSITPIQPDTFIAIALDKSLEMIIGILGILKSGAAYVPIDPNYPSDRIQYILDDTKAPLILSQSQYTPRLVSISDAKIISLDNDCYQELPTHNLKSISTANDLAYVIYTSGTTGQPKGVLQSHYNVIRLFATTNHQFKFTQDDIWILYHNYVFDFSVWELWGALFFGGKIMILNDNQKHSLKALCKFIINNKVTVLNQTPTVFYNLLDYINDIKNHSHSLDSLRYIIFGGDKLNFNKLNQYFNLVNNRKLETKIINMYGITEITVHATFKEVIAKDCNQSSSIIGTPLSDMQCYILNQHGEPTITGNIGELYIGGAGLAHGYLNKPELTAEKFIPNPFATETDKANGYDHLYKTGDLVRRLPDGDLEYIGRKDKQVKIRGFRIELSEIENSLINITGIRQAVVINRVVNDEQYLFAYYTANEQINPELVLDKLTNKLPHYMVPNAALQINEIPLTINGKIDMNALPDIRFESSTAYIEPKTEQERIVCQAFSNLLLIDKVGIDDDFFKLGGNSIKAIQLAIVLQSNLEIDVAEIFDLRTPRKLANNKRITHDLLISKLEQIKHDYANQRIKGHEKFNLAMSLKKEQYLSQIANMRAIKYTTKPIQNVLLTGATGFLGCNLLNQLLTLTPYKIFLCIRAKNKTHAIERIAYKYQFYFDMSLENHFADRLVYIPCDLEKRQIGVSDEQYHQLTKNIDSI